MSFFMADQKIVKGVNYPQGFPYGFDPSLKSIQDMPTDHLLAYWNMHKTANNKILESINGYDATVRDGINNVNGLVGNALTFDGITEVDLGILPAVYSAYTVSMWANLSPMTTPGALYFAESNLDDNFLIEIDNGYLKCTNHFGVDTFSLDTTETLSQNEWLHILFTYNGELKRIYVNNVLKGEQSLVGHVLCAIASHNMGYYSLLGTKHYKGTIDQARLYNKVVTLEERNKLYSERLI